MEEIISNRDQQIEEFKSFGEETKKKLSEIVRKIGWSEEKTEFRETPLICPFDSSHRLPPKSVEKHIGKCLWKAEGYREEDLPLSIPSVPPDAPTCLKLDEQMIENILRSSKPQDSSSANGVSSRLIPRTSDRLLTDFTPEERRILYDYVVAHTEQPDLGEDIADLNKTQNHDNKTSSYLELLAQERNLKRRRAKHRGVHTNKKSQTEITREIINQQMEMFSEYLLEKNESKKIELNSGEFKRDERNGFSDKKERNSSREFSRDFSNEFHHKHERRDSSRDYHQYSSRKESHEHSKHHKSSRSHESRDRHHHRHSEDPKKHKKHEKNRSDDRDYDHHKHKSKSRKRSHSREDKKSKKRRKSPN